MYRVRWTLDQRNRFVGRWKKFREDQGLSQSDLAEAMGISLSEVSRIERGRFTPRDETVRRFGEVERRYAAGEEIERSLAWAPGEAEEI